MTSPEYRDRFGNDMAGLLDLIAENECHGIKWYRYPRAKEIAEDWPHFFKQEQRKRVDAYLMKRISRSVPLPKLQSANPDSIPDLGLF